MKNVKELLQVDHVVHVVEQNNFTKINPSYNWKKNRKNRKHAY